MTAQQYATGEVFQGFADGPEMLAIPSGSFLMGTATTVANPFCFENESPQHPVTIGYRLAVGKYPVTFAQWDACVADGGTHHKPDDCGWGRGQCPVINVSWNDAQEYLTWLNRKLDIGMTDPYRYRLLSEAEWEYACRAGTTTQYNTPNGLLTLADANYYDYEHPDKSLERTTPVGCYPPNAWGLFDMLGNVEEWVQDGHKEAYQSYYRGAPRDGSALESGVNLRGQRGGSYCHNQDDVRSATREISGPSFRYDHVGFRLARRLP